jgi:hypothetical protein
MSSAPPLPPLIAPLLDNVVAFDTPTPPDIPAALFPPPIVPPTGW